MASRLVETAEGTVREFYGDDGIVYARELVTPSAAKAAEFAVTEAAATARRTKISTNKQAIIDLGTRAARFAKDPAANPADNFLPGVWATATAGQRADIRQLHALLGRMAFAIINGVESSNTSDDI